MVKKEEKSKIDQRFYFDVKLECMLPATLTYRVYAKDAQEAAELIKKMTPTMVKHKIIGKRDIKLQVYDAGSSLIKFIKSFIG